VSIASTSHSPEFRLNPYAEADGKPVKTEKSWSYRDLDLDGHGG